MLKYKKFVFLPEFTTNTYLLWCEKSSESCVIDMSYPDKKIVETIKEKNLHLKYIINTHGHADHIGGNEFLKKRFPNAELLIHEADAEMLTDTKKNLSA